MRNRLDVIVALLMSAYHARAMLSFDSSMGGRRYCLRVRQRCLLYYGDDAVSINEEPFPLRGNSAHLRTPAREHRMRLRLEPK